MGIFGGGGPSVNIPPPPPPTPSAEDKAIQEAAAAAARRKKRQRGGRSTILTRLMDDEGLAHLAPPGQGTGSQTSQEHGLVSRDIAERYGIKRGTRNYLA